MPPAGPATSRRSSTASWSWPRQERRRAVAEVRSAVPLTADQVERLRDALNRATNKEVEIKVVVDPSVLGGVVARVGDVVIDGSVRHRLEQMKEQI